MDQIAEFESTLAADAPVAPRPAGLSEREVEVLRLLATGATNGAIAEALVISAYTVANHVRSILNKTGAANRTEAAMFAARHGITGDAAAS